MYKKLRIVSYENYENYESEYQNRLNSIASVKTSLSMHPFSPQKEFRSKELYPIFFMSISEILYLTEKIFILSKNIIEVSADLPGAAKAKLIISQAINEIQSTNNVEGVQSTKQEISSAIKKEQKSKNDNNRFYGIANLYMSVINQETQYIHELADFRAIYDKLFLGEISEDDLPDGEFFRKKPVYITQGNKKIHSGNPDEQSINRDLNNLIIFMNQENCSYLVKASITHYFFEYIHPFYDGNGRMGRFLLSSYLTRKLDVFSGISISEAIFNHKKAYEKAFEEVSHPRNKADVTHFIVTLLKIISSGQEKIYENINILKKQLDTARHFLSQQDFSADEKSILYLFYQNYLFDLNNELITNKELVEYEHFSRYMVDTITKALAEKGALIKVKNNPVTYQLSDDLQRVVE